MGFLAEELLIRPIQAADNAAVAAIIRQVMPEFGASGPGFAIHDPEVGQMFEAYSVSRAAYFVVCHGLKVVGGGGVAHLAGASDDVCELRKMYFVPEVRGLGLGQRMLDLCLGAARSQKYGTCYLETLKLMTRARALYEKNGFRPLSAPMGATGHFSCDAWYARQL